MPTITMPLTSDQHLHCGKALFNFAWTLIEKADRTDDETELMINASHASWMHWSKVGKPVNFARSEWQLARVYAVAGRAEPEASWCRCSTKKTTSSRCSTSCSPCSMGWTSAAR